MPFAAVREIQKTVIRYTDVGDINVSRQNKSKRRLINRARGAPGTELWVRSGQTFIRSKTTLVLIISQMDISRRCLSMLQAEFTKPVIIET